MKIINKNNNNLRDYIYNLKKMKFPIEYIISIK